MEQVREQVSIPAVGVRVNVCETADDRSGMEQVIEGLAHCRIYVDYVSVSAGSYTRSNDIIIPRRDLGAAPWRAEAGRVRRELRVPVLLGGNITDLDLAETIVKAGDADVVLLVRSLLADPELYRKWLHDRWAEVQPCTGLYLCKYHSRGASHLYCPHNPVLRRSLLPKVTKPSSVAG